MNKLEYWIIDVDGTMTDGGIYYDDSGNELKKFCTKDAAGLFAAEAIGIRVVVLTGRECPATEKRMKELGVSYLFQNIKDKKSFLEQFMKDNHISKEKVGYIGDDLNDLSPMRLAGYLACPKDSCTEIREIADYVSPVRGGHGAVRDIIEHKLRESDDWDRAIKTAYHMGT